MKKIIPILIMVIIFLAVILSAYSYQTIYNPFTGKLDYHITANMSGENITADNFFGSITELDPFWSANQSSYWNTSTNLDFTTNLTTTGNLSGAYIFGDGSQLHGIQHGNLALFLLNNASDISGSKILFTEHNIITATTLSRAITATGTEYQNWTTNDGVPNLHMLLDGVNEMHVHARVTASGKKDTTLLWKIWQNDSSDNMNLLFTSEESSVLTTTLSAVDIHMAVDETDLNLSDRLTIQLIANIAGSGGNPTVEVQVEGITASRVELVVPGANVGTFVPYLGAIRNLDIGAHNFSVDTSVFFVDSNNNRVGIGTSNPYSGLHYQGDIFYLTPNAGADSNDNITIKNYAT